VFVSASVCVSACVCACQPVCVCVSASACVCQPQCADTRPFKNFWHAGRVQKNSKIQKNSALFKGKKFKKFKKFPSKNSGMPEEQGHPPFNFVHVLKNENKNKKIVTKIPHLGLNVQANAQPLKILVWWGRRIPLPPALCYIVFFCCCYG